MSKVEWEYELRLLSGKVVTWLGVSGEDAVRRYEACTANRVVAWRPVTHGLYVGANRILEPGDKGW